MESDEPPPSRRRRTLLLSVMLGLLGAGAVGLMGWQSGWFGPDVRPRELLRKKLEAPAMTPSTPIQEAPGPRRPQSSTTPTASAATVAIVTPPAGDEASPAPVPLTDATSAVGGPSEPSAAPAAPVADAPPALPPSPSFDVAANASAAPSAPRFAVEFGPFMTVAEAERTERQLAQAGHPTVRFRQQGGSAVYAVLIEQVPSMREAQLLVSKLRQQGFPEAMVLAGSQSFSVRIGEPLALRGAVQLAEQLRGRSHQVRLAAQPGEAASFVIRHGNFASRQEAEDKSAELERLGLPNHVVQVR
jgi:hypothetical protein